MRIVIATGGTGGHCYPAMLVAEGLKSAGNEVLFAGGTKGFESRLASEFGIPFISIRAKGFPSKLGIAFCEAAYTLILGIIDALKHLVKFKPDVVIGGGGYCSAPVLVAARIMKYPILLMEQNLLPGKVTRLFAKFASKVMITFPESASYLPGSKTVVTGTPIRPRILALSKEDGRKNLGLDPELFTILVVGASQGAQSINNVIVDLITGGFSDPKWQWIHITGKSHFEGVSAAIRNSSSKKSDSRYVIFPYLEDVASAYAAADLVVARSGASTIAELTGRGVPAILIPYPYAAEQHQLTQARYVAEEGAAVLLLDSELGVDRLIKEINLLLENPEQLNLMKLRSIKLGQNDALAKVIKETLTIGSIP